MAIFSSFYAMKSAGVLISEIDLSTRVAVATSTSGGTVFASARGTLDPYYTTSGQRFTKMYGEANPQVGFGHGCDRVAADGGMTVEPGMPAPW